MQRTPTKISNAMEKNLTSGLQNYLQIFATKCQHLFAEEEARAEAPVPAGVRQPRDRLRAGWPSRVAGGGHKGRAARRLVRLAQ